MDKPSTIRDKFRFWILITSKTTTSSQLATKIWEQSWYDQTYMAQVVVIGASKPTAFVREVNEQLTSMAPGRNISVCRACDGWLLRKHIDSPEYYRFKFNVTCAGLVGMEIEEQTVDSMDGKRVHHDFDLIQCSLSHRTYECKVQQHAPITQLRVYTDPRDGDSRTLTIGPQDAENYVVQTLSDINTGQCKAGECDGDGRGNGTCEIDIICTAHHTDGVSRDYKLAFKLSSQRIQEGQAEEYWFWQKSTGQSVAVIDL